MDALTGSASLIFASIISPKFDSWSLILSLPLKTIHWRDLKTWSILLVLTILYSYFTVAFITLSGTALQLQHLILWNFIFLSETPSKNLTFLKKSQVRVKSRSKFMPVFLFYLWLHLRQTFRTARSLISGQVFSQWLWKLVQMESTCFKTLKL